MKSISRTFLVAFLVVIITLLAIWSVFQFRSNSFAVTEAASLATLDGYAWSETIGWISMKGTNYQVDIQSDVTHPLKGYAWSENIGWIQFGNPDGSIDETAGCPAGTCAARIISDGGTGFELTGWARALAYSDSEAGGWDGWISLNCDNNNSCGTSDYAVRISANGSFPSDSYAWGDMNAGWINFAQAQLIDMACPSEITYACVGNISHSTTTDLWCAVNTASEDCTALGYVCSPATGRCDAGSLHGSFTVTPTVVRKGNPAKMTWSVPAATTCRVSGADGFSYNGSNQATNLDTSPITFNQSKFTLYCTNAGGTEIEIGQRTVQILPTVYER